MSTNPVTWDNYETHPTPAKWLGTVEATNAKAAIEAAVREFRIDAKRLIAMRVREK